MARKKKKKFKINRNVAIIVSIVFVTLLVVLIFSRKEEISRDNYRVEIDKSITKIYVGDEIKLGYTVFHGTGTNRLIWSTSNSNIATVDGDGVIRGVSFGEVKITVELMGINQDSVNIIVMSHPVNFRVEADARPIKNWYNREINLTFNYQNISNIKYCVVTREACNPNINYNGKIRLKNGVWHLYVKGLDRNNKEFTHDEIFQIDLTSPKCTIERLGKWGNDNTSITVTCDHDLSGIDRYEWYRDDEKIIITTSDRINASDIYQNGKHKYYVKIYDNVGHVSTVKVN